MAHTGDVSAVLGMLTCLLFDITVDEDHLFICDGIVVHNRRDLSTAGKQ